MLGSSQYNYSPSTGLLNNNIVEQESQQTVRIDGYNFHLFPSDHELFQGPRVGFVFSQDNENIYLQGDRTPAQIYSTCVHEKLHTLGIQGGDTYEHDMVSRYDSQIVDETCISLMYQLNPEVKE